MRQRKPTPKPKKPPKKKGPRVGPDPRVKTMPIRKKKGWKPKKAKPMGY